MTDVLVFHHAQGLTDGVRAFAGQLRAAGHQVTVPDLYEGETFANLTEGVAHAQRVGFDTILARGQRAARAMPAGLVYAGLPLGVMPAQMLAQTRPGARGVLLLHAYVPLWEFGPWPPGVPVQVHGMDADESFVAEGDLDAARELTETVEGAELYPGDKHLFTDSSLPDYDESAAALLRHRVLDFLDFLGKPG